MQAHPKQNPEQANVEDLPPCHHNFRQNRPWWRRKKERILEKSVQSLWSPLSSELVDYDMLQPGHSFFRSVNLRGAQSKVFPMYVCIQKSP